MKKVTMFITYDGEKHETKSDALKHLDRKYGKIICELASKLCQMKYTEAQAFINEKLDYFGDLIALKSDMELEEDDENPSNLNGN